ncbi:isochorismate synthase [Bacillus pseudomycoides]|nr:isochorismate synthase [Bacillus pseudomycoides]
MIQTKQHDVKDVILTAIQRAADGQVLVSSVKQVEWIDPLLFYAAGPQFGYRDRCYFADPSQHVIFAGVGSAFTIANSSNKRFQNARQEWERLKSEAVIHRDTYEFGTGPLLFGGFAFDPRKERTDLWKSFHDTTLQLPAFLLTVKNEKTWLTVNRFVSGNDCAEQIYEELQNAEEQLLQQSKHSFVEENVTILSKVEVEPGKWLQAIERVQEEMKRGAVQKVVLAREMQLVMDKDVDSASVLAALRIGQPDCYVFAFDYKGTCFLGATPERLLRKEGETYTSMCLAGSIGRGASEEETKENGYELLHDEKNLAEHDYVVDMIRSVLTRHCETVDIPYEPQLLKTKNLLHLYTPVQANGNGDLLSMIEELHPTPALGGTPREEALKLIREVELLDRGLYGAPIGWIDEQGNGEFAVALRCGLLSGKQASLFAGCGIVIDSKPHLEYEETRLKFKPMLSALEGLSR